MLPHHFEMLAIDPWNTEIADSFEKLVTLV
jgi:hypothetical protein